MENTPLKLSDFDYTLDSSLVAVAPREERDSARLLVYDRKKQTITHTLFKALPDYLDVSDLLVMNDTRVFPARLRGFKKSGGKIELLFLRPSSRSSSQADEREKKLRWEVLLKGKSYPGLELVFKDNASATILRELEGGRKEILLQLSRSPFSDLYAFLEKWGETPLPPYILKQRQDKGLEPRDQECYQTLFARHSGSAAAPTAGLHFSEGLLKNLDAMGVQRAETTLHIGLDTFRPISSASILDHKMHREWFRVSEETARAVNKTRQRIGRVVAVGTTVVRALESALRENGESREAEGETGLFITPGYHFRGIDALITNFHLPKSSLLVLVSAFAGCEAVKKIYSEAILRRYHFYSYGDAMLIL